MNKFTWTLLACIFLLGCQQPTTPASPPSSDSITTAPPEAPQAHPDTLCNLTENPVWLGTFEEKLVFTPDMHYEWKIDKSGIACESGNVTLDESGNVVLQHQANCDAAEGPANLILGSAVCACSTVTTNAEYRVVMRCKSGEKTSVFGNANALTQAGDTVSLQGIPSVVVRKPGHTKRSVRVRTAPNPDASTVLIEDMATGTTSEELPADAEVLVLARTLRSYTVGEWENPWYFVQINGLTGNAWVFGRYLTVKGE
jgi:hypothetical protein